jgi:hypothetical protein
MSALEKLKDLMTSLKVIEHDRWDTAAHAVLELEHKFGLGGPIELRGDMPADGAIAAEEIAALKDQVAHLTDQVKVLGEAVDVLLKQAPVTAVEAQHQASLAAPAAEQAAPA